MTHIGFHWHLMILTLAFCQGCLSPAALHPPVIDTSRLPSPDRTLKIAGLSPCAVGATNDLHLNSQAPITVIVHGCNASSARFRSLAQVFAFHGQQAICFNYDDRDSLTRSAQHLVQALNALSAPMQDRRLTIIGHSQGGLIARKALTRVDTMPGLTAAEPLRLVTISSPYAGIGAADHCASPTARWISLGMVVPICKLISGDKWFEITHASDFIRHPGQLRASVTQHLKIDTDETGTCRRQTLAGDCLEDDFVFSLAEQYYDKVDRAPRTASVQVAAGHSEIVGDQFMRPDKLIEILQARGILNGTSAEDRQSLRALLAALYR